MPTEGLLGLQRNRSRFLPEEMRLAKAAWRPTQACMGQMESVVHTADGRMAVERAAWGGVSEELVVTWPREALRISPRCRGKVSPTRGVREPPQVWALEIPGCGAL